MPFRWQSPDLLECTFPLAPGKVLMPMLADAKGALRSLPPVIAAGNPEYRFHPEQTRHFQRKASSTGGRERLTVDGLWERIAHEWQYVNATPVLALLAIILLLLDVSQRKFAWMGSIPHWSFPVWHWPSWKLAKRKAKANHPNVNSPVQQEPEPEPTRVQEESTTRSLEDVLRAASRKNSR